MASRSWLCLSFPKPRTFLFLTSLRFGAEMISLSLLFNKLAGLYGILALFTGYSLSLVQLSMYIYSLFALVLLCVLMPHIGKGSPLQNLMLAYFYLVDTLLNTAYTGVFAATWFFTLDASSGTASAADPKTKVSRDADVPGTGTMGDTAGFTNPNVDGGSMGLTESLPSIIFLGLFTLLRVYFTVVLFSYARQCVLQYMASRSAQRTSLSDEDDGRGPFAVGSPLGEGWRGKLGRGMTGVGKQWWAARNKDDEEWARNAKRRFVAKETPVPGTALREQRARSGTGPPPPRPELQAQA